MYFFVIFYFTFFLPPPYLVLCFYRFSLLVNYHNVFLFLFFIDPIHLSLSLSPLTSRLQKVLTNFLTFPFFLSYLPFPFFPPFFHVSPSFLSLSLTFLTLLTFSAYYLLVRLFLLPVVPSLTTITLASHKSVRKVIPVASVFHHQTQWHGNLALSWHVWLN